MELFKRQRAHCKEKITVSTHWFVVTELNLLACKTGALPFLPKLLLRLREPTNRKLPHRPGAGLQQEPGHGPQFPECRRDPAAEVALSSLCRGINVCLFTGSERAFLVTSQSSYNHQTTIQ